MIVENGQEAGAPNDLERFPLLLRKFLERALPGCNSKSALSIEIAHRTGMSMDHVRRIFDGKAFPIPSTVRKLLELGGETELAHEISDLYRKLRIEFIRRTRGKQKKTE